MLRIPRTSLIVLCGIAGSGKSTFASCNFKSTEIVSSDRCRAMISDSEENMAASKDAFELFHFIIEKRMEMGKLVVADSTALSYDARKKLLQLARRHDYYTLLLIFDVPIETALKRNSIRQRNVFESVIEKQYHSLKKAMKSIDREGFDQIFTINDENIHDFSCNIIDSTKNIKSFSNIDIDRFRGPIIVKAKNDMKVSLEDREVEYAINLLCSSGIGLPWMIYYPPLIPAISGGSIKDQMHSSFKYYRSRGCRRLIIYEISSAKSFVFIICRDAACSKKYFLSDTIGEIYSPYNELPLGNETKLQLLDTLHDDLDRSGYFVQYDTEFVVFEAFVAQSSANIIIPCRILSHSRPFSNEMDNLNQLEHLERLCGYSGLLKQSRSIIADDRMNMAELALRIEDEGYEEFLVKPVRRLPCYKGWLIQPEIICTRFPRFIGEGFFNLSTTAYNLSYTGMEKYVEEKFSSKYFEYVIGSAAINNRMANARTIYH